jgi:hypothetical protein
MVLKRPPILVADFPFNNSFLGKLSLLAIGIYNFWHKTFWSEFKNHFPFALHPSEKHTSRTDIKI